MLFLHPLQDTVLSFAQLLQSLRELLLMPLPLHFNFLTRSLTDHHPPLNLKHLPLIKLLQLPLHTPLPRVHSLLQALRLQHELPPPVLNFLAVELRRSDLPLEVGELFIPDALGERVGLLFPLDAFAQNGRTERRVVRGESFHDGRERGGGAGR